MPHCRTCSTHTEDPHYCAKVTTKWKPGEREGKDFCAHCDPDFVQDRIRMPVEQRLWLMADVVPNEYEFRDGTRKMKDWADAEFGSDPEEQFGLDTNGAMIDAEEWRRRFLTPEDALNLKNRELQAANNRLVEEHNALLAQVQAQKAKDGTRKMKDWADAEFGSDPEEQFGLDTNGAMIDAEEWRRRFLTPEDALNLKNRELQAANNRLVEEHNALLAQVQAQKAKDGTRKMKDWADAEFGSDPEEQFGLDTNGAMIDAEEWRRRFLTPEDALNLKNRELQAANNRLVEEHNALLAQVQAQKAKRPELAKA